MRSPIASLASLVVALSAAPALAQQPPADTVAQVIRQKPRAGMDAQYEAGRKKHMAWHKAQSDPWEWNVYEITTGPDTGSYLVSTIGHQWADIDTWNAKFGAGDTADSGLQVAPFSEGSQVSYWTQLNSLSRLPPPADRSPILTLTIYYVKHGHEDAFTGAIAKVNGALTAAKYPLHSIWYRLSNGGEMPAYAVVTPRANLASMAPPQPLRAALESQLGKPASDGLLKELFGTVDRATSEMLQRRDDLGYRP